MMCVCVCVSQLLLNVGCLHNQHGSIPWSQGKLSTVLKRKKSSVLHLSSGGNGLLSPMRLLAGKKRYQSSQFRHTTTFGNLVENYTKLEKNISEK